MSDCRSRPPCGGAWPSSAIGVRRQPRWFALAVVGSALYGVMTVGTAWVIGRVTDEYVAPAVAGRPRDDVAAAGHRRLVWPRSCCST